MGGLCRRYPRWAEGTCAEIAEIAAPWYVTQPAVEGTTELSRSALLEGFSSNDGVLTCSRCRALLGTCECRCGRGCAVAAHRDIDTAVAARSVQTFTWTLPNTLQVSSETHSQPGDSTGYAYTDADGSA